MKDLDRLLDDISKTNLPAFPFNESEIRKTLTNIDEQKKTNIFNKRGVVIMSIFSSILIVFVSLMLMMNNQNQKSIIQFHSNISFESNANLTENIDDTKTNNHSEFKQNSKSNKELNNNNNDEVASHENSKFNIHDIANSKFDNTINVDNELSNIKDNSHTKFDILTLKQDNETDKPNNRLRNSFNSVQQVQKKISLEEGEKFKRQIDVEPIDTNIVKIENGNVVLHYYKPELSQNQLDSINLLFLTDAELERINIKKNDCGYILLSEQTFPDPANNIFVPAEYFYPKSGLARSVYLVTDSFRFRADYLKNPNWAMNKSAGIFPLGLYLHRFRSGRSSFLSSSFRHGLSKFPKEMYNNPIISNTVLKQIRDINQNGMEVNSVKIYYSKEKYPNLRAGVPIFLKVKKNSSTGYILINYPATKNFIQLLPERYSLESFNHLFAPLTEEIDIDDINNRFTDAAAQYNDICNNLEKYEEYPSKIEKNEIKQIAGIEKLTLSYQEAEKLGIFKNGDTLTCLFEDYLSRDEIPPGGLEMINEMFGYDTTKAYLLLRSNPYIVLHNNDSESKGIKIIPQKYTGWDYKKWSANAAVGMIYQSIARRNEQVAYQVTMSQISQSPFLRIDTSLGKYIDIDNIVWKDTSGNYKPLIRNLLPVNIVWEFFDGKDSISNQADIWFYISKEFAELLPERYRTPILNELDIISRVNDGSLNPDDACKALKGEISYLGICKLSNNLLESLNIYPNPLSGDNLNISFAPKKNCNLKIELFNHEGKFISTLSESKSYSTYINSLSFNVGNIAQGIYFINISDDNGNSVTEKFIKIK